MFKNLVAMPEIVEYRTIIARLRATYLLRRATSRMFVPYFHMLSCARPSHGVS